MWFCLELCSIYWVIPNLLCQHILAIIKITHFEIVSMSLLGVSVSLLGMSGRLWEWSRHPGNIHESCDCLRLKVVFLMYICPSQSPMASPFFYIKKKDGKLRPCQDYRYLNDWTIKNAYPLPLISKLTNKLAGAKYFTKLDVQWGYNNIRIKDGNQWKAAFKTNKGLFEPTVMFFGMCNSPATFQSMMNSAFQDLIEGCIVLVYMDDIFLFAKTLSDLEENTKKVLQQLWE